MVSLQIPVRDGACSGEHIANMFLPEEVPICASFPLCCWPDRENHTETLPLFLSLVEILYQFLG